MTITCMVSFLYNCQGEEPSIFVANKVPNSVISLRPFYLIREVANDMDLLQFVIKETDQGHNDLNKNGSSFAIDHRDVNFCSIKELKI